ncbi:glycosyl hydrolase [Micromonospora sagamiensis]|uniref:Mannan endo-1,4-beta-mannosidase n=1 Tax=Micromonospora sagamiensis TaxID=47875 RepID=A0A562WE24_9ACTN|nr:glycosyl hydrolase [Micromonospora sagamiensis]TWJ27814.1 mannan endo-1,4-beta-mannosidase [Micromonospora sagamiensis]BCL13299.1 hypothetical protein GCM10017556_10380 [Micromonospora sagamiensis]
MTARSLRALAAAGVVATAGLLPSVVVPVPDTAAAFAPATKATVVSHLRSITGSYVVSGQHNKEPASQPGQYTQQVHDVTGQYPGLWGGDMMFRADDIDNRQRVIDQAKTEWANGSLVTLTWHACSPTVGRTCEFEGGVKTRISDTQFQQIVTGGTALNQTWRNRMAEVVPYLRQLRDAGVPVLWRPFHEMNESWNWWGARPGANGGAKIYQQMRDYFDSQGLDNLVWVWNVQDNPAGGWATYYPGDNYADVVSLDVWYKSHPSTGDYQQIQSIAGSKPTAIAEMGKMPTGSLLDSQPRWSYFMIWSEHLRGNNTDTEIRNAYYHPRVLNQGEIDLGGGTNPPPTGKIRGVASGRCVDVAGANSANGTAVQLYTCDLNGTAQAWTRAADGTFRALGKCLDVTGGVNADGTRIQLWDCTSGNPHQQWRYDPSAQTLTNPATGRCLDATGQQTTDGTRLQIWTCNSQGNQRWSVPG